MQTDGEGGREGGVGSSLGRIGWRLRKEVEKEVGKLVGRERIKGGGLGGGDDVGKERWEGSGEEERRRMSGRGEGG